MILDGKKVRNELLEYYENKIKEENIKITLAIIYVGSDEPSKIYINNKIKYCEKVNSIIDTKNGFRPSQKYRFKPLKGDIWI